MCVRNNKGHSPTDFAAYLGRREVIANILSFTSSSDMTEENLERILKMVKEGVTLLSEINKKEKKCYSALSVDDMKEVVLCGLNEYEEILEIMGKSDFSCYNESVSQEETEIKEIHEENKYKDTKNSTQRKTNIKEVHGQNYKKDQKQNCGESSNSNEKVPSNVGDAIVQLIREIRIGLNALSQLPEIIKTVNQITNPKDNK